jgi:hypothetical protein
MKLKRVGRLEGRAPRAPSGKNILEDLILKERGVE